jgi:hypothetical protein
MTRTVLRLPRAYWQCQLQTLLDFRREVGFGQTATVQGYRTTSRQRRPRLTREEIIALAVRSESATGGTKCVHRAKLVLCPAG